jgi:hypothetical protein
MKRTSKSLVIAIAVAAKPIDPLSAASTSRKEQASLPSDEPDLTLIDRSKSNTELASPS